MKILDSRKLDTGLSISDENVYKPTKETLRKTHLMCLDMVSVLVPYVELKTRPKDLARLVSRIGRGGSVGHIVSFLSTSFNQDAVELGFKRARAYYEGKNISDSSVDNNYILTLHTIIRRRCNDEAFVSHFAFLLFASTLLEVSENQKPEHTRTVLKSVRG